MSKKKRSSISLMNKTRELLKANDKSLPEVYRETGISFYWLRKFRNGEIKDPSVNRIQNLYEYLTGEPLIRS